MEESPNNRVFRNKTIILVALAGIILTFWSSAIISASYTEEPPFPYANGRFGFGWTRKVSDVLARGWPVYLNAGWYWDWGAHGSTELPPLQYVQTIRLKPELSSGVQISYTATPTGTTLLSAIAEQPGALWFIGNEPDCTAMDNMRSEWYARAYHDLYYFIKAADPTAKIVAGNIVQPTFQRLMYLDNVLTAYQTYYGESMPADIWAIHNFILCEKCYPYNIPSEPFAWGACWVPDWPSRTASESIATFYSVYDHWDINIFNERIIDFRQWMYDNGYRNRPLIISEYGVLFYEGLVYSGSTYDIKNREFMYAGFDWMQEARNSLTGYHPDDSRLVQRWAWYSLDHGDYPGGTLFDLSTYQPTVLGNDYAAYTALVTPTVDLRIFDLTAANQLITKGVPVTATIELTVSNAGNIVSDGIITVTVYQSATIHIPIGGVVIPALECCGDHQRVSMPWANLIEGLYGFCATAATTYTETDPVCSYLRVVELAAFNDSPTLLGAATTLSGTVIDTSGVTYTWAFGDGEMGSGAVVQHVYQDIGFYTATVTATSSVNSLTANTYVTITAGTPISGLLAFNDGPTLLDNPTILSATVGSGSGVTYTWAFGDGQFFFPQNWPDSGKVVTHTYPAVGAYTAMVTATNRSGQMTAVTTVVVQDIPVDGLSATNNSPTALNQPTAFTATVTAGSNVSYTWDFGDSAKGSGAKPTHTYDAPGIYVATVTASNSTNALQASTYVTVETPVAGLHASNDSPTLAGRPTTCTATLLSGDNVNFIWDLGDGQSAAGTTVVHIYPDSGVYTATITATNSINAVSAFTVVTIEPVRYVYLPLVVRQFGGR